MKKRLLNLMKLRAAMMLTAVVVTFLGLPTKAWATTVDGVKYIDENGVEQTKDGVTVLEGGGGTNLSAGWYVVNSNISYTGRVTLNGEVTIILADGCTMNIGTPDARINDFCISGYGLTIYGQSGQTGALYAYNSSSSQACVEISDHDYTQHGGNVTFDASNQFGLNITPEANNSVKLILTGGSLTVNSENSAGHYAIAINAITSDQCLFMGGGILVTNAIFTSRGAVEFTGGNLTTQGIGSPHISISWSSSDDSFKSGGFGGPVTIADGKSFTDGTTIYSGTLSYEQRSAIAGKTLVPAYTVTINDDIFYGTLAADKAFVAANASAADKIVTLTPTPDAGYAVGTVFYSDDQYQQTTVEPNKGVYSFTMPTKNVIASATFKKLLTHADISITLVDTDPLIYSGNELKPAFTVKDGGEDITNQCDITYSNNTDAGIAAVTFTAKADANYAGDTITTFTINPASVTLTANSRDTDVYDGTVKTVTGFTCSVEGLTFDGVSASGSGTEAGDYDVTFSGVTLNETKDASGNYVVTETVNGKLTIAPPPTYTLTGLAFAEGMHYATYCNTTDKDLTLPEGLKAYVVSGKNEDVVTLVGVEFLPKPKGTTYFPLLLYREDVNAIVGTALEYKGDASAPTFNYMRYALTEKSVSGSEFVLYDDDFVRATGTIPAGKCYLDLDDAAPQTVGIGAEAGGVRIAINGTVTNAYSDDFGKVSYTISGTTCTLTVTPPDGNYHKASELTVTKTVDGSQAATRGKSTNPGYNVAVEVTASEANQNLASETTYTFEVEEPYGYDVTVVFDARMSIDDATVTLEETNYTFDNQAHQPGVTVKLGDTELTADKDYLVSYPADCTSTGEKTITISGRSVYCGTVTAKYTIEEATPATTLVSDKLTLNSTSQFYYDYNGQTISVSYDGTKLTAEDYDISIKTYDGNVVSQCVDLGSYIAVITGKGKYTGTVEKVFLINPKSFMGSNILITLDKTVFIHNGITQEPTVTVKDGEKTLEKDKDYHIGYSQQKNTANGLEYISCSFPCEVGKYTVNITGIGNYSGEISRPFEITSGAVAEPNATADGVTITGPSDEMRARIESAHKAGKKLEIQIPSSVDGQPVTRIADNAFADAQENVTLVFKNFDPSITFGENSTGDANLETTPEELGNLAKQPNLLETLKKGKIFAWLESFPLRSFSSSTNIKIKAEADYQTTLYAIVDSVCKNQLTNSIVKAALGQDRELNVHIDTKDFLQAFKCNVKENTLSKQYEVSMASLNSTMYSAADKSYVYTANNGILVACDTTGIMTFADGYVDEFVESLNLDAAAKTAIAPYVITIKNKIKNTIRKHGAKLEAKFNEQTAATGDAQTYAPNMLVPVVEARSYKNDSQFTYFALTTRNKKNEFVKIADSDTTTPAGKALLKVPTSMVKASAARSFAISGVEDQDEATAIGGIDRDERATGNDAWYSISGQRIDQPTAPGIYIRNGKKVIVK